MGRMKDVLMRVEEMVEMGEVTHDEVMGMTLDEIVDLISS